MTLLSFFSALLSILYTLTMKWRDYLGWILSGAITGSLGLMYLIVRIAGRLCGCF